MAERKQPFGGFIGPSYTGRSHVYDAQETINMYLETDPTGGGKNGQPVILIGTPGLKYQQTLGTGPIRAIYTVSNQLVDQQFAYVVSGNEIYQIASGGAIPTLISGNLTTSSGPVSVADNGNQVVFVDGQNGYFLSINATSLIASTPYYNGVGNGSISSITVNQTTAKAEEWTLTATSNTQFTVVGSVSGTQSPATAGTAYNNGMISFTITQGTTLFNVGDQFTFSVSSSTTLTQINDPNYYTSDFVSFQDGYFIFTQTGTNMFFLSDLYDVVFPALNQEAKSGNSDPLVAAISVSRQLYLLGTNTTEIWWDAGQSGSSPFARQDGRFSQVGCAAPASIAILGEQFFWIGSNAQGTAVVYTLEGSLPSRISTHAVEYSLQNAKGNIQQTTAFSYQQEGHYFYCLNVPGTNCTWVYDMVTEQWHKRQSWINGVEGRWLAEGHCLLNDVHLVGDYVNGNIYQLDLDTYTDNGEPRYFIRQTPHKAANLNNVFYKLLDVDFQFGVGVADISQGAGTLYTYYGSDMANSTGILYTGIPPFPGSDTYQSPQGSQTGFTLTNFQILTGMGYDSTDNFVYIGTGDGNYLVPNQVPAMPVGTTRTWTKKDTTNTDWSLFFMIPEQFGDTRWYTTGNFPGTGQDYSFTIVVGPSATVGDVYDISVSFVPNTSWTASITRQPSIGGR